MRCGHDIRGLRVWRGVMLCAEGGGGIARYEFCYSLRWMVTMWVAVDGAARGSELILATNPVSRTTLLLRVETRRYLHTPQ